MTDQDHDREILHVIHQCDETVKNLACLDSKAERFAEALNHLATDLRATTDIETVFSRTESGYTVSVPDSPLRRVSVPNSLDEVVSVLLDRAEARAELSNLRDLRRKLRIDPE